MSDGAEMGASVHDLHKSYGQVEALRGVSFDVSQGEVVGLLGPNGAGKSTTIGVLLGFLRPSRGSAFLLGGPPNTSDARRRVGYVPEAPTFGEHHDARSLLGLHAALLGIEQSERSDRIHVVLNEVGLHAESRRRVRTLSKGMQQRLALAVALLGEPRLLVLDEPTSNLDPVGRNELCQIVHRLRERGRAVLLASHVLAEVESTCDRVVILRQGHVVLTGKVTDLCRAGNERRSLEAVFFEAMGRGHRGEE